MRILLPTLLLSLALAAPAAAAGPLFGDPVTFPTGGAPAGVALDDLDGDGRLDAVAARQETVAVLRGTGDGRFTVIDQLPAVGAVRIDTGDLDGDGDRDLVTTSFNLPGDAAKARVYLRAPDGTYTGPTGYDLPGLLHALEVADVTGDGRDDVVTGNDPVIGSGASSISTLPGRADGTLGPRVDTPAADATGLATGDFDRDGRLDLVTTDPAGVAFRRGDGSGGFAAAVPHPVDDAPIALTAADVDADGRLDVVGAANAQGDVSVALGRGDGTFAPKTGYGVAQQPTNAVVGDLNGDGHADIATANQVGVASVLLGRGDGTFAARQTYDARTGRGGPSSIAIGDVDGSGRPDLVLASGSSTDPGIVVLRNTGADAAVPDEGDLTCRGRPATIIGEPGADRIEGTPGRDVIVARGGDDFINAGGGDDLVCGGDGDDVVNGNGGSDRVYGDFGRDRVRGGADADRVQGNGGRDDI